MVTKTTRTAMTRWVVVPAVVMTALAAFVIADTALAQPPGGRGGHAGRMGRPGGPGGQLMHLRAVDLSEAQQGQIRTIHEQSGDETRAVNARLRAARRALQDAVTADGWNEGEIFLLAGELGTAEGDAAVQQAELYAQVWSLLTPEQKESAREAEAEMEQRMAQRRQRMGERRERRHERRQEG